LVVGSFIEERFLQMITALVFLQLSINRPFPYGGEVVIHSLDSQVKGKEVFLNY